MLHNSVFLTIILALILNSIRFKSRATRDALCKKVFLEISQNSLKKRLWHRYFPVNFVKFLKTRFYRTPLDDCDLMSNFLGLHSDCFQLQSKSVIVPGMHYTIKDFFSKCVMFIEEILDGKLHFLCSDKTRADVNVWDLRSALNQCFKYLFNHVFLRELLTFSQTITLD